MNANPEATQERADVAADVYLALPRTDGEHGPRNAFLAMLNPLPEDYLIAGAPHLIEYQWGNGADVIV